MIPDVRRRRRQKVCGHPDVEFATYLSAKYLADRSEVDGLMVGCGSGHTIGTWVASGAFRRLDAFDIAPDQVARAQADVAGLGLGSVVRVSVADASTVELPERSYDVVIAEQALHHLSPLETILRRIGNALRPGGVLLIDDFVGPRRHQWTPRQLDAANALLESLPEPYRRRRNGKIKAKVVRPSLARMLLTDPSEAIESSRILPLVERHFDLLEVRGYGGTILEVVLSGIAHNFLGTDAVTQEILGRCFATEDAVLESGELAHDFVVAVARSRRR